jgi:hypothetical protein
MVVNNIYQGLLLIVSPLYCSIRYHSHVSIILVEEVPKVYQYFVNRGGWGR